MPRAARKISESGVYHIIVRGVNRQNIFEDERDAQRLLDTLDRYREVSGYEILAYCLMSNHMHLLMKENAEPISDIIKRISGSYVFWFNKKYNRCGHLFQERYKSEAVNDDEYLLTAVRYIHQNPVRAGMVSHVRDYRWSSYREYIEEASLVSTGFVLKMFSDDEEKAKKTFSEFNSRINNDFCLDYDEKTGVSDEEVRKVMEQLGVGNEGGLRLIVTKERNEIIRELKSIKGVTIRQLSRLTGISKSVIGRT